MIGPRPPTTGCRESARALGQRRAAPRSLLALAASTSHPCARGYGVELPFPANLLLMAAALLVPRGRAAVVRGTACTRTSKDPSFVHSRFFPATAWRGVSHAVATRVNHITRLSRRREPRRGELSRIASNSAVPSRLNPAPLSESGEGRPAAVLGVAGVRVGDGEVTSRRRASEPSRRGPGA